jgi:glucose/arabinose dehydrogenase
MQRSDAVPMAVLVSVTCAVVLSACSGPGASDTRAPAPTAPIVSAPATPTTEPASSAVETPAAAELPTVPPSDPTALPIDVVPALQKIADGLQRPTFLTHAGDGSGRLYITEQPGRVRVWQAGQLLAEPFLDITDRVGSRANEQGLLSIAFSPDFLQSRRFFVNYTDRQGATVIAGFLANDDGLTADPSSEWQVMRIPQPYANHNGGQIAFGPDGMLYIGMGDGGSAGDPQNFAQNPRSLLGKLLRIDVSQSSAAQPYRLPPDNPSFGPDAPPEIWATGLRNPWRFSFDRLTGDLYIADVGQNRFEEVNFQPPDRAARTTAGGSAKGSSRSPATRAAWRSPIPSFSMTTARAARSLAATSIAARRCLAWSALTSSAITAPAWSGRCAEAMTKPGRARCSSRPV